MVGIVQKVPSTTNTTIPKHHHHGGAICPSYGVRLMDLPDPMQVISSEGVEQGCFSLVLYETIKNCFINLILLLLVFLLNRSPAVENGSRNGIHH